MDRADIVPVSLEHPDHVLQQMCPELRNIALGVTLSCVQLEQPAFALTQAFMGNRDSATYGLSPVAMSPSPNQCRMFFELTTIETVYFDLETAARKVQVKIVWHSLLTSSSFWGALPNEPLLGLLRPFVESQPI